MATPGKLTKKDKKKHVPTKTSFTSPFALSWKIVPQKHIQIILGMLKEKLLIVGLEKKELKVFRPWRKKEQKQTSLPEAVPQVVQEDQETGPIKNGWTNVAARQQLAIGINEVTRALERNQLHLLLVCNSVRPKHMTDHLLTLSATRGVPACQIPSLSQTLSELLGLKSVLALGFRGSSDPAKDIFKSTLDIIKLNVPPLDVKWLTGDRSEATPKPHTGEEKEVGQMRGQKRKLPDESPSSSTLEPLNVKRIIANPAKKRKLKTKKKFVK